MISRELLCYKYFYGTIKLLEASPKIILTIKINYYFSKCLEVSSFKMLITLKCHIDNFKSPNFVEPEQLIKKLKLQVICVSKINFVFRRHANI